MEGIHIKPINFRFYDKGPKKGKVIFEIEGGSNCIESKFARKNEENFFHFIDEIIDPHTPFQNISPIKIRRKSSKFMNQNFSRKMNFLDSSQNPEENNASSDSNEDLAISEK